MKFAAYAIWGSSITTSLAQLTGSPQAIQCGSLAILGWSVWYLLARALPAFRRDQKEDRAAFLASQEKERKAHLAAQEATRRDFQTSLAGMSNSLDNMAVIISQARRDS